MRQAIIFLMDGWDLILVPMHANNFANVIKRVKNNFMEGPMGVFEMEKFQHGTKAIAEAVAEATKKEHFHL